LEQIPRKPLHLAAIGHEAEGDAAFALDRHGVVQIENLAIGHQVQVEQASLLNFGLHFLSPRVPVGIDDCPACGCVVHFMCLC
jgi:hypothetical protein